MTEPTIIFAISMGLLFFSRLPLGVWFYNRECKTDKGLFDYSRAEQTVLLFYWYTATKKENKTLASVLNFILIITVFVFLSTIMYVEWKKSL
jgi:hypothetical protein